MEDKYTTILMTINVWHEKGKDIKEILFKYGLKWREDEVKELTEDEIVKIFERFKIDEKSMNGKEGMWVDEVNEVKVKIVMTENVVLLIYKGDRKLDLYYKLIMYCRNLGLKVVDIRNRIPIFTKNGVLPVIWKIDNAWKKHIESKEEKFFRLILTREDVIRICKFTTENNEYYYTESKLAANIRRAVSQLLSELKLKVVIMSAPYRNGIYKKSSIVIVEDTMR